MNEEVIVSSKVDLTLFDPNKKQMEVVSNLIKNMVITDESSRDKAFNLCQDANYMINLVEKKRLELLKPYRAEKAKEKLEYEEKLKPIDAKMKDIMTYACEKLINPLQRIVNEKHQAIIAFNKSTEPLEKFFPSDHVFKKKGREVEVFDIELEDLNKVPEKFIVKGYDAKKVREAVESGEIVEGFKITKRMELRYK